MLGQFTPGGAIVYTITITNSGTGTQADNPGNELTDILPSSLSITGVTASSGTAAATTTRSPGTARSRPAA